MEQKRFDFQCRIRTVGTYLIMFGVNMSKTENKVEDVRDDAIKMCEKLIKELKQE
jgi:hypothetical protein